MNRLQPPELPDDAHPLGNHKRGDTGALAQLEGILVDQKNVEDISAARFEGEYDGLGETAPEVPSIPSVSVPDNPAVPPGVQSGTTTLCDSNFPGGGRKDRIGGKGNFCRFGCGDGQNGWIRGLGTSGRW